MKTIKTSVFASVLGALTMFGCAHNKPADTVETKMSPVAIEQTKPPVVEAPVKAAVAAITPQQDLDALIQGATVTFAFDSSQLTQESQERLARIADQLRAHPELGIKVAGNTDERGTEEYNLSLGAKRAGVAKDYLVKLGVDPLRVQTISYGKERPVDDGHDEAAYARNRRADLQPLNSNL